MRKASSEPGLALSSGDADGGRCQSARRRASDGTFPKSPAILLERRSRASGMNARGRRSSCEPSGRTRRHGPTAAAIGCRYTCYPRSPAQLAPVRPDVLPGPVNGAGPAEGPD